MHNYNYNYSSVKQMDMSEATHVFHVFNINIRSQFFPKISSQTYVAVPS